MDETTEELDRLYGADTEEGEGGFESGVTKLSLAKDGSLVREHVTYAHICGNAQSDAAEAYAIEHKELRGGGLLGGGYTITDDRVNVAAVRCNICGQPLRMGCCSGLAPNVASLAGLGAAEPGSKPHPDANFETLDFTTGAYERVENGEVVEANIVAEDLVRINDSGIVPTEFKVLVLPDLSEVELRAKRIPNFALPPGVVAPHSAAVVSGTIIAMSPAAFSYHDWPEGCRIPAIGERVVFGRYSGLIVEGKPVRNEHGRDEPREYRLLNDKDIAAILEF